MSESSSVGVCRPVGHLRHLPRVFSSAPRPSAPDAHPGSRLIVPHKAHKCAEGASAAAVNGQAGEQACEHAGGDVKSYAADVAAQIQELRERHLRQQWAHLVSKYTTFHRHTVCGRAEILNSMNLYDTLQHTVHTYGLHDSECA